METYRCSADADTRNGHGLPGRETVRGRCSDGDEKSVFRRAVGAGGDRDGGWLRRAIRTRRDCDDHVFIEDVGPAPGPPWLTAIEFVSSNWARQIVSRFSIAGWPGIPAEEAVADFREGIRQGHCDRGESFLEQFLCTGRVRVQ